MTVGAIAAALDRAGTELVFGVPGGGPNLDLIEACEQAGLRFVLTHGETPAAIMAATYAELTGRPGACLATRGPGAASMVNGVAHALLDRCAVIALTDVVPAGERERIAHQLLDQRSLMAPAVKATCTLGSDAGAHADRAVRFATAIPWGPVHVDVDPGAPSDMTRVPAEPAAPAGAGDIDAARRLLSGASRPLIVAGVGCRGSEQQVAAFARKHGVPVLTTYKAKGTIDESDDLAAGMLTGATIEAPLLAAADAILGIGFDPIELIPAPWPYPVPIVSLGPWVSDDRYFEPQVRLVGRVAELLAQLDGFGSGEGWGSTVRAHRRERRESLVRHGSSPDALGPADVVVTAHEVFGTSAIATVDAGAHMLVVMELWTVAQPGHALASSGLATMGFSLPAAIAAALVHPDQRVVCFTGEGGLGMCVAELETLVRMNLPVTVVVLDDARLSLIELKQRSEGQGGANAVRYRDIDFAAVGTGMGLPGERVTDATGLRAALTRAAETDGPFLVDAVIDPRPYVDVIDAIRGGSREPRIAARP
jgi:acetolactate synthase-1/2/3 large subunit